MSDNAAIRNNFVSDIYQKGVDFTKYNNLNKLPEKLKKLHVDGYIHIHDLEAFGAVYNCSMPKCLEYILKNSLETKNIQSKIYFIFESIKNLIINLGVCQSGGIGFLNFDKLISDVFDNLHIKVTKENITILEDNIKGFIYWININKTRYCREAYYITLNIGLDTSEWGRIVSKLILATFSESDIEYYRPNIVFKLSKDINYKKSTPNYDLYLQSLKVTAKKMIPTYLLVDNIIINKEDYLNIGIMGCRTTVYSNLYGKNGSLGRGNLASVSINLPRLALENDKLENFKSSLLNMMENCRQILQLRIEHMTEDSINYLNFIYENQLWSNVYDIEDLIKQGTISIGFIGLSEAIEILIGEKYYKNKKNIMLAEEIISFMRQYVNKIRFEDNLNYTLLGSAGEMISGRFCNIDNAIYKNTILDKGYYTNSFHINVNNRLSVFEKISIESRFHKYCNGGCITYIELESAPLNNILALMDLINYAYNKKIVYLGINFPLDKCLECGNIGTFDDCNKCNSQKILRIRRVSGYLENLNYFTEGKKSEESERNNNIFKEC